MQPINTRLVPLRWREPAPSNETKIIDLMSGGWKLVISDTREVAY